MGFFTNLFGSDYMAFQSQASQFNYAREQVSSNAVNSMFGSIGNVLSGWSEAQRARDYADQMAAAKAQAEANARLMAQDQVKLNTQLTEYSSQVKEKSARYLEQNAQNLYDASQIDLQNGLTATAKRTGVVKSQYANAGVSVSTGSAKDVTMNIFDRSEQENRQNYKQALNQVNDALNQSVNLKYEAAIGRWSTEQQNKLLLASVNAKITDQ